MLPLKYLFSNNDLAEMALKNWAYDEDSLALFKYYRISSNAVYPFRYQDKLMFLRLSPCEEKSRTVIEGELEFIDYLMKAGMPVASIIPSKRGANLEVVETPWGSYYAVVFKGIVGDSLEDAVIASIDSKPLIYSYGCLMGKMHNLSRQYRPMSCKRPDVMAMLEWIRKTLICLENEEEALKVCLALESKFMESPKLEMNYGLIHYDFELDNILVSKEFGTLYAIDFDDAFYGWYALDVSQSLASISEECSESQVDILKTTFIEGYNSESEMPYTVSELTPYYSYFANLYGYTRIRYSMDQNWLNEPDWMVNLREKLSYKINHQKDIFKQILLEIN